MLRFTNDSPNIVLLTDENYGRSYVGVRVLVSHGNVFLFFLIVAYLRGFEVRFILCKFVLGIHVRRHGQNGDPKGIEREEAQ